MPTHHWSNAITGPNAATFHVLEGNQDYHVVKPSVYQPPRKQEGKFSYALMALGPGEGTQLQVWSKQPTQDAQPRLLAVDGIWRLVAERERFNVLVDRLSTDGYLSQHQVTSMAQRCLPVSVTSSQSPTPSTLPVLEDLADDTVIPLGAPYKMAKDRWAVYLKVDEGPRVPIWLPTSILLGGLPAESTGLFAALSTDASLILFRCNVGSVTSHPLQHGGTCTTLASLREQHNVTTIPMALF